MPTLLNDTKRFKICVFTAGDIRLSRKLVMTERRQTASDQETSMFLGYYLKETPE